MVRLRPHIMRGAKTPVVYHEYGKIMAIQTRWKNPGIAERLLPSIEPGDVLVGHSNGATVWMRCLQMGAPAAGFIALNAALKDDVEVPPQLKWMHVYYNEHDKAVPLTNFPFLRQLAFDPLWGDMGRDGYCGADRRVKQWDGWNREDKLPRLAGHSTILDADNADDWGFFIGKQIRAAMGGA